MCGIAGEMRRHGNGADEAVARRMIRAVHHRGPDASGVAVDGPVALAHARLSIIDLVGGVQPMASEDGRYRITFNGEIFNYVELRERLIARGRRFRTDSDTEVLLVAYEELGPDCVAELNGQWAFAVWDTKAKSLFLSRDRLGVRPIYYAERPSAFIFASEVRALLVHPDVGAEIDPRGIDQLLTIWAPIPPRTVFRDVRELPPGSSMRVDDTGVRTWRHWQADYSEVAMPASVDAAADDLLTLLTDAVRIRFRADVPVGGYLSGGLDSTVVTAIARKRLGVRLDTFSVGFEDGAFDETQYQNAAAEALGTHHASMRIGHGDIAGVFPDVVWHAERPMLRTAPAPLFLLSRFVHDSGYKVVLTGEGADEMLGGYDIFKEAKVRRFWAQQPESVLRPKLLQRLYPYMPDLQKQPAAYLQGFFNARPEDLASPFFSHQPRWGMTARTKLFLSDAFKAELAGYDVYAELAETLPPAFASWDPFCQAQYLETEHLLPGYILATQGDRMAMAHAVEGRFPFLDHRVVSFAAKLPPRLKMRVLNEKFLLKHASAGLIPEVVRARSKQPYRAPGTASFYDAATGKARADWVAALTTPERLSQDGVFNPGAVTRLLAKAAKGQVTGTRDDMAVVAVLSTQLLADRFVNNFAGQMSHDRAA